MAIYHLDLKVFGRSKEYGERRAVACAAYRAGEKLRDEKLGLTENYTRKHGVVETHILAPDNAPEWVYDRKKLWNEVEAREDKSTRRKDAQFAKEIMVALPNEMNRDQQRELVLSYVQDHIVSKGMVADIAIHDPDSEDRENGIRNVHAHIMYTMREIDKDTGFGNKLRMTKKEWRNKGEEEAKFLRKEWAEYTNEKLREAGIDERVDYRSLKDMGIDRAPNEHMGPHRHMAKREMDMDMDLILDREEIEEQLKALEMEKAELESMMEKQKQYDDETKEEYIERLLAEAREKRYGSEEEQELEQEQELERGLERGRERTR